jgi:hypothetical protein
VNPTLLGGNPGILATTFWEKASGIPLPETIATPFAAYPELHTANCETDGFLAIGTVIEERQPPISPQTLQALLGGTLHIPDVNYALGDLLRIVAIQADSMP